MNKMKRSFCMLLSVIMLLSVMGPVAAFAAEETAEVQLSESTELPENPETPANSETPEAPENPETPVAPEAPENPETPVAPEAPENPETPVAPEAPENPETPAEPEPPKNHGVRITYVTKSGVQKGSELVVVPMGTTIIRPSDLSRIPDGYRLVNTNDQKIVDTTKHLKMLVEEIPVTPSTRNVRVTYVTESGRQIGTENLTVAYGTNAITPANLYRIPEGYKLVNTSGQNIVDDTKELTFLVEKTSSSTKELMVNYVTEDGRNAGTGKLIVAADAVTVNTALLEDVPYGYVVAVSGDVAIEGSHVNVTVREKPVAPSTHNVRVTYVTESGRKIGTENLTVENGTNVIMPSNLKRIPEGYKLVNTNGQNILDTTKEIKFLVVKTSSSTKELMVNYVTEDGRNAGTGKLVVAADAVTVNTALLEDVPYGYVVAVSGDVAIEGSHVNVTVREKPVAPSTHNVRVTYVTESGRQIGTENLTVKNGTNVIMPSDLKRIPEGYKLVNTNGQNILDTTKEIKFLVVKTSSSTKDLIVNYVTEDGRNAGTGKLIVSAEATAVNTALLEDVPYGYELAITGDVAIEGSHINVTVREKSVAPSFHSVRVNYVTVSGRKIGSERLNVKMGTNVIMPSDLRQIPEGYKLVNTNGQNILDTTKEIDFLVEKTSSSTKDLIVNYVTEDGRNAGTGKLIVAADATYVNTALLEDVPYGYELAIAGDVAIEGNHINVTVREKSVAPSTHSVRVNYVTVSGRKVGSERLTVKMGTNVIMPSDLRQIPEGYKLVNTNGQNILDTTKEIDFLVEKEDVTVRVNYVTEEGRQVGSETVKAKSPYFVDKEDLKKIPEGYKFVSMSANDEAVTVVVKADKLPVVERELVINYVLHDGKNVGTETIKVTNETNVVRTSDLKKVPNGYKLVNTSDRNIVSTTVSLDILVEKIEKNPTEKTIIVNFVTADGTSIMSTTMVVPFDAKTVEASSVKGMVPYGYTLVTKKDMTIDEHNAIYPVVAAKKADPNKDKVPKTGDDFNVMMMTTMSVATMTAAAVLIGLKKKADNR